jgi:hypothetical protein
MTNIFGVGWDEGDLKNIFRLFLDHDWDKFGID